MSNLCDFLFFEIFGWSVKVRRVSSVRDRGERRIFLIVGLGKFGVGLFSGLGCAGCAGCDGCGGRRVSSLAFELDEAWIMFLCCCSLGFFTFDVSLFMLGSIWFDVLFYNFLVI